MSSINNNIQELKRRKVLTSAGLYAFSSFIIMQVANIIVPALHLPDWSNSLILILLILGFPIAMIFAWLYHRTPTGFVKTDDESLDEGLFGIIESMSNEEKCKELRVKYNEWKAVTIHNEPAKRKQAIQMIERIKKLRKKYKC